MTDESSLREVLKGLHWIPVAEKLAPRHETVLALSSEGEVYQARVCYGMHAPFWCGHSKLNFGKVLADEGIVVTHWHPLAALASQPSGVSGGQSSGPQHVGGDRVKKLVERAAAWTESDLRKHPTTTLELIDTLSDTLAELALPSPTHAVAIERSQTQGLQAAASPGSERELLHEAWEILRLGHPVTHECVFVCNCTEKLIANIEVALAHPTPGSEREE